MLLYWKSNLLENHLFSPASPFSKMRTYWFPTVHSVTWVYFCYYCMNIVTFDFDFILINWHQIRSDQTSVLSRSQPYGGGGKLIELEWKRRSSMQKCVPMPGFGGGIFVDWQRESSPYQACVKHWIRLNTSVGEREREQGFHHEQRVGDSRSFTWLPRLHHIQFKPRGKVNCRAIHSSTSVAASHALTIQPIWDRPTQLLLMADIIKIEKSDNLLTGTRWDFRKKISLLGCLYTAWQQNERGILQ